MKQIEDEEHIEVPSRLEAATELRQEGLKQNEQTAAMSSET